MALRHSYKKWTLVSKDYQTYLGFDAKMNFYALDFFQPLNDCWVIYLKNSLKNAKKKKNRASRNLIKNRCGDYNLEKSHECYMEY